MKNNILRYLKVMTSKFCPAGLFYFFKKNITTPQNYLSFARDKSFLQWMLFCSLNEVSIRPGWTVFIKMMLGVISEWGDKQFQGGIYHGWCHAYKNAALNFMFMSFKWKHLFFLWKKHKNKQQQMIENSIKITH